MHMQQAAMHILLDFPDLPTCPLVFLPCPVVRGGRPTAEQMGDSLSVCV